MLARPMQHAVCGIIRGRQGGDARTTSLRAFKARSPGNTDCRALSGIAEDLMAITEDPVGNCRGRDGDHRGPCRGLQRRHLDMAKGCLSMRSQRVPSAFTRRYIL